MDVGRRVGRGVGEVDGCWDGGVVVGETVGLLVLKKYRMGIQVCCKRKTLIQD